MRFGPGLRAGCTLLMVCCSALVVVGTADRACAREVTVVCDLASGEIVIKAGVVAADHRRLSDPLPGRRTAEIWIEEHCPSRRCGRDGRCTSVAPPIDPAGWYVLCSTDSGDIGVGKGAVPSGFAAMSGPFAEQREAERWIDGECRGRRCSQSAECLVPRAAPKEATEPSPSTAVTVVPSAWAAGEVSTGQRPSASTSGGGWAVGEVQTGNGGVENERRDIVIGPQESGPNLAPLVDAARMSVAACAYPTALANADQLARFDPLSPWLAANHERLRHLATRQRETEQAIWRAGSLLNQGKLKDARKAVHHAAGTAVACQDEAVSVLLHRIDEVIAHDRSRKQARNARLAGELLAGLFVVNQAVISHHGGSPTMTGVDPSAATIVTSGSSDPCSFNYSYPAGALSVEPLCGCAGYRYDAAKLKCVK